MDTGQRRILLVDVPPSLAETLDPLFSRKGLSVERVRGGTGLAARLRENRYELILFSAEGIDPMFPLTLSAIRKVQSPCRAASVLLAGTTPSDPIAVAALESGANGVLPWPAPPELCRERIAKFLDIPLRRDVRVLVKLKVSLETKTKRILCESQNLSKSGILIRSGEPLAIGTEAALEFTLPGEAAGISVRARVVRHTKVPKEPMPGIGLQFVDVPPDALSRLERFLGN